MIISFVIPVYNCPNGIKRCVESIVKLNRQIEYEIILIDDGSTDEKTGAVCDELANINPSLRVLHTKNSGPGSARNTGLAQAMGKYIYFADADDEIIAQGVLTLLENAERTRADVCMGSYCRILPSEKQENIPLAGSGFISYNKNAQETRLYHQTKLSSGFGYLWNKLYRREFLVKHKLQMDTARNVFIEDTAFNLKVWSKQPIFYIVNEPCYYYHTEDASITRRSDPEIHQKAVRMLAELYEYFITHNCLDESLDLLVPLLMRVFCWALYKNMVFEKDRRTKLKKRADAFTTNASIRAIASAQGAQAALKSVPSLLQRIVFNICLRSIKRGKTALIRNAFALGYPLLRMYTKLTVK